jgi:hypothetical protein
MLVHYTVALAYRGADIVGYDRWLGECFES